MKIIKLFLFLTVLASLASCNLDLANPNAATEADVLTTKDGLLALAKGVEHRYATSTLPAAILTPGISGREIAAMTTFSSLEELEDGGAQLASENERVTRLFARTMRTKGMAETLLDNMDNVSMNAGTKSALRAHATLFRSMCLGILAYNWEKVPAKNSKNNDAQFVDREAALRDAIAQMSSALTALEAEPASDEFNKTLSGIDLNDALNLYIARFNLIVGDYDGAIDAAKKVNLAAAPSYFYYDAQNPNGIFTTMFEGTIEYAPIVNFGLPTTLTPDAGDQRVGFYLASVTKSGIHFDVDSIVAPFFNAADAGIPVYYPSEATLILAEAYANKDDFDTAETYLNEVRKKAAADDVLGIGAGLLTDFTANNDKQKLLNEIYKNRRIELFLSGLGLEDSRRLGRPTPPATVDYSAERNRNFYPYPADERLNNPNTPANPTL
ncbi:MAG TPA: RagB/SusD family nutrient uptake outer membrane protein [Saprospiraceae bacterium]|nr:RagB/SusD family nutrient uptake outer membrane protein [Saprospiraceae bacterium]